MLVNLNRIKKHLNIDVDFTDDDEYIESLEQIAEDLVQKHIDKKFEDIIAEDGVVPTPLLQAILLFIGNMYDNRESVAYSSVTEVPKSLDYILSMYRDYNDANI
jgi:uncharacterized phage protein (predicted DNA packaging)